MPCLAWDEAGVREADRAAGKTDRTGGSVSVPVDNWQVTQYDSDGGIFMQGSGSSLEGAAANARARRQTEVWRETTPYGENDLRRRVTDAETALARHRGEITMMEHALRDVMKALANWLDR